ncbi:MAG: hypothetical protein WC455_24095 [Dehalococcoidia bacterium]
MQALTERGGAERPDLRDATCGDLKAGGQRHGHEPLVLLRSRPSPRNADAFLAALRRATGGLRARTGSDSVGCPNRRRFKHRLRPDGLVRN